MTADRMVHEVSEILPRNAIIVNDAVTSGNSIFNFINFLQSKTRLGNLCPLNAKSSRTAALVAKPPFLVFFKVAILTEIAGKQVA